MGNTDLAKQTKQHYILQKFLFQSSCINPRKLHDVGRLGTKQPFLRDFRKLFIFVKGNSFFLTKAKPFLLNFVVVVVVVVAIVVKFISCI